MERDAPRGGGSATHVALCDDIGSYLRHWCKVLAHVAYLAAKQVGRHCEITDECPTRGASNEIHICDSNMNGSYEREAISRRYADNESVYSLFTTHHSLKKAAFTLAEVLITLGIIGVVAALTIPTLIAKYQEKVTVTRLEKAYSILSQAFEQAINDHGTVDNWCDSEELNDNYKTCSNKIAEIMKPYLKTVKICQTGQLGCFDKKYKTLYGNSHLYQYLHAQQFVLADGETISFDAGNGDRDQPEWCKVNKNETNGHRRYIRNCGEIHVDINGYKSPNILSKDLFYFRIYKDGIAPAGLSADTVWVTNFEKICLGKELFSVDTCAGWVLTNKNMDYLHCRDLSWTGKRTCK